MLNVISSKLPISLISKLDTRQHVRLRLLLASFLALFTELLLIRYIAGYVPVVAYFSNIILIASFFGLGLGFLLSRKGPDLQTWYLPLLLSLVVLVRLFGEYGLVLNADDTIEPFWMNDVDSATKTPVPMSFTVLTAYLLSALVCLPVGQAMGKAFIQLKHLKAYHLDLLGSLIGVICFGILSALHFGPTVWFSVAIILSIILFYQARLLRGTIFGLLVLVIVIVSPGQNEKWSAYYKVNWQHVSGERTAIFTNDVLHQIILNIDSNEDYTQKTVTNFKLPYGVLSSVSPEIDLSDPDNCILIVGAGSGNDIAVAQSLNAACIDAVEIDRTFPEIGKALHPQQPYSNDNVTLHINDARTFFKKAAAQNRRYAVIIFGTLDSMALTGGHSTRLDSYVYTRESFEDAYSILKPGGVMGVYHMSARHYIAGRILLSLFNLNNQIPTTWYFSDYTLFNWAFAQVKDKQPPTALQLTPDDVRYFETLKTPTDDWPFLFLEKPLIPSHYVYVLIGILILSTLLVRATAGFKRFHFPMFLLGAGFLLLETKSVTQMSLLFGSTWVVNILVFSSILLYLILANLFVYYKKKNKLKPMRLSLFITLIAVLVSLTYLPTHWISGLDNTLQWLVAGTIIAVPVALAGVIFSSMFSETDDMQSAFGSNLFGTVVGGSIEYSVMIFGVGSTSLMAAVLYIMAYIFSRKALV